MPDDEKQVDEIQKDENGAIVEDPYKDENDMMRDLVGLQVSLKPHGHSVASLLLEFANRMHGIRI